MSRDGAYYRALVAKARATPGGHLAIGPEGCTLHWAEPDEAIPVPPEGDRPGHTLRARTGGRLSGANPAVLKALCLRAGVPVLDCSRVPFAVAVALVARGPMVAVGEAPDPPPWHALSHAPLAHVAALYRAAGAEALHVPDAPPPTP